MITDPHAGIVRYLFEWLALVAGAMVYRRLRRRRAAPGLVSGRGTLLTAALLGACAAPAFKPEYGLAPEQAVARVVLLTKVEDPTIFGAGRVAVSAFEPADCAVSRHGLALTQFDEGGTPHPLLLAADEPVVLTLVRTSSNALGHDACPSSVVLTPASGFEYQVTFEITQGWCTAGVQRRSLAQPAAEWTDAPEADRHVLCLDEATRASLSREF